jgi:AhpD family alkylhydroperoxidase
MHAFEVHNIESAPERSKPVLEAAQKSFGSIPNLFGVLAESPATVRAYAELGSTLEKSSAFDPTELQVVLMTTSFENDCEYCMAAHSAIAGLSKVPQPVIKSLRDGSPLLDPRLEALRVFTRAVVQKRGEVTAEDIGAFANAGYERRHVLEVILGVSFKTLSNYVNHIAETPVDAPFQRMAWSRPPVPAGVETS